VCESCEVTRRRSCRNLRTEPTRQCPETKWIDVGMNPKPLNMRGELMQHHCKRHRWRRVIAGAQVLTLLVVLVGALPCYALTGNVRYEAPYAERGVAVRNWVYPWYVNPNSYARHVSSIYAHHQDYNPYSNDGLFDGVAHNYIHAETGLVKRYNLSARVFWQYNKTSYGLVDWDQLEVASVSSGQYVYFEINNWDMQNDSGDTWRMAYNGSLMKSIWLPMTHAKALCSSERYYSSDDMRSSFRDLKIKSNTGTWSYWNNCQEIARGITPTKWGSYSASHWYHLDY